MKLEKNVYSGKHVADYIREITPFDDNIPESWIQKKVLLNTFLLVTASINIVFNDIDFESFYESYTPRYIWSEEDGFYYDLDGNPAPDVTNETVYNPIVIVGNKVIDGYSRAAELLNRGEDTIKIFIDI